MNTVDYPSRTKPTGTGNGEARPTAAYTSLKNKLVTQANMRLHKIACLAVALTLTAGCTSYKKVPYLQDPEVVNNYGKEIPLYDAKIMPKDLLSITINTTDPQASAPFNLTVQTPLNAALTNINTTTQPTLQQYLVNNKGEIDFPVLGRLKVGGLTKNQAEDLIRERLTPLFEGGSHRNGAYGQLQDFRAGRSDPSGYLHREQRKGERIGSPGHGGRHDRVWRAYQCEADSRGCRRQARNQGTRPDEERPGAVALLLPAAERHPLCHSEQDQGQELRHR